MSHVVLHPRARHKQFMWPGGITMPWAPINDSPICVAKGLGHKKLGCPGIIWLPRTCLVCHVLGGGNSLRDGGGLFPANRSENRATGCLFWLGQPICSSIANRKSGSPLSASTKTCIWVSSVRITGAASSDSDCPDSSQFDGLGGSFEEDVDMPDKDAELSPSK